MTEKCKKNHMSLFIGSVNQNVEPSPSLDFTPIHPPNVSIIVLQIANPNPVPCAKSLTFTKRRNIRS